MWPSSRSLSNRTRVRLGPCLVGLLATAAALAQAFAVSAAESVATELALRLDPESRRLEAAATLTVTGGRLALLLLGGLAVTGGRRRT